VGPLITDEIDPWAELAWKPGSTERSARRGKHPDFIFPLDAVIRYISQVNDTRAGRPDSNRNAPGRRPALPAGDMMEVMVEGVGTLRNPVS